MRFLFLALLLLPLSSMALEAVAPMYAKESIARRPLYPICGPKDYLTTDPLTARPLCKRLICEANQYLTSIGGIPSCKTIPACGASQFLTFNNNAFACVAYVAPPPAASASSSGGSGGGQQTISNDSRGTVETRNGQTTVLSR
jgi:hypothetical protein